MQVPPQRFHLFWPLASGRVLPPWELLQEGEPLEVLEVPVQEQLELAVLELESPLPGLLPVRGLQPAQALRERVRRPLPFSLRKH